MTIFPGETACLRCLFDGPPDEEGPTCQQAGVLGPLPAEVGRLMAMEAIKMLTGQGRLLTNRMLSLDLHRGIRREVIIRRNRVCSGCAPE